MTKGVVRSAKGEMVDFDLLKIKQQMVSFPKPIVVEARENFIDNKFKRQLKRQTVEVASTVLTEETTSKDIDKSEIKPKDIKVKENNENTSDK